MDEQRPEKNRKADRLNEEEQKGVPAAGGLSFGMRAEDVKNFIPLPINLARSGQSESPVRWRIVLDSLGPEKGPLGLDILGDVVLGRGKVGTLAPDVDMEPYNAVQMGVSRRHALLRPTANNLYVIDLGSTNGTFHNGVQLAPGEARVLVHNDTLSLGNLTFTINIVKKPEARPVRKLVEKPRVAKAGEAESTKPLKTPTSPPETVTEGLPPGLPRRPGDLIGEGEEVPTLIVTPATIPLTGKRLPDRPLGVEIKEEAKEPETAPAGPGTEAKEEKDREPALVPKDGVKITKPEAEKAEVRKPAETLPEPKAGAKEEAREPKKTPSAPNAEAKKEEKK